MLTASRQSRFMCIDPGDLLGFAGNRCSQQTCQHTKHVIPQLLPYMCLCKEPLLRSVWVVAGGCDDTNGLIISFGVCTVMLAGTQLIAHNDIAEIGSTSTRMTTCGCFRSTCTFPPALTTASSTAAATSVMTCCLLAGPGSWGLSVAGVAACFVLFELPRLLYATANLTN